MKDKLIKPIIMGPVQLKIGKFPIVEAEPIDQVSDYLIIIHLIKKT